MITDYIDVDDGKWGIILIFDFDTYEDDVDLVPIMKAFGMKDHNVGKALSILSTNNSGMTISNYGIKMSAVFIGKPTSPEQFWDTIAHECIHVCQAILDYYGEDNWDGEIPAYLDGYLFRQIVYAIGVPCRQTLGIE